jgi:small neutral amino acid transporter SnatA (MarC family)
MTSPKLLAVRDIAGMFVAALAGGAVINYLASEFTAMQIITGAMVALLAYSVYTLYTIRVGQYEYQQKLNKMVDKLHE